MSVTALMWRSKKTDPILTRDKLFKELIEFILRANPLDNLHGHPVEKGLAALSPDERT